MSLYFAMEVRKGQKCYRHFVCCLSFEKRSVVKCSQLSLCIPNTGIKRRGDTIGRSLSCFWPSKRNVTGGTRVNKTMPSMVWYVCMS